MKVTFALTVIFLVCGTTEVFGCGPSARDLRSHKSNYGSGGCLIRFRQICEGNPNNDYFIREKRNETHRGVDVRCQPGARVFAPFRGQITHLNDTSLVMTGLKSFRGYTIKMENFYVSSELSVNMSVYARQYIGKMPEVRLVDDYEFSVNCIHIEMSDNVINSTHPSWFICPAIRWSDRSRKYYSRSNDRFINVDHDKHVEEAPEATSTVETEKEMEEGSGEKENGPGSGESVTTKTTPC